MVGTVESEKKIDNIDSEVLSSTTKASGKLKEDLKYLGKISVLRSLFHISFTWIQLSLLISACIYFDSIPLLLLGILLIGARQYGLLILLHDASHGLLHPKRHLNDSLALWLIAAPCGSSFVNSRSTHLMHHRFLGHLKRDPDYFLYSSGEPVPKQNFKQVLSHFGKLLFGGQIVHTFFGNMRARSEGLSKDIYLKLKALIPVVMMQGLVFYIFLIFDQPLEYLYLWVLPLVSVAVLLNGIRVFCDHSVPVGSSADPELLLISYQSNPVEIFFLSPFHMNYHAEHHFFPFVPHYNLPKLRALLKQNPDYWNRITWRSSYFAYMAAYLLPKRYVKPA